VDNPWDDLATLNGLLACSRVVESLSDMVNKLLHAGVTVLVAGCRTIRALAPSIPGVKPGVRQQTWAAAECQESP
jgi:hypothetical protein